jgi:hypothetical protein
MFEGKDGMISENKCLMTGPDGTATVLPEVLTRATFDEHGLAWLYADGWYRVRHDGKAVPVMPLDNGPDEFPDGLARSEYLGKIGYVDAGLRLVIPRRYDGAYPFDGGIAAVCVGCTVQTDDEHRSYVGGDWFCIGIDGREVRRIGTLGADENGATRCSTGR